MAVKKLIIILSLIVAAAVVGACGNTSPGAQADPEAASSEHHAQEDAEHHEETGEQQAEAGEHQAEESEHHAQESEHHEETGEHHEEESEHHAGEAGNQAGETGEHHAEGMDHVHGETPSEYQDMSNPLAGNADAVAAGQEIYEANCASCHGPQGEGDGPAAATLDPQPASLANAAMMQGLSDGYLFWRISEGGAMEPFNSAMPAWGETLSEEEIWQTISYVRTLSGDQPDMHQDDGQHGESGGMMEDGEDGEDGEQDEHHAEESGGNSDHHEAEGEHHEDEGDHHE